MIEHRQVVLAMFVVAALIVGTTGYDTIQGERSADVQVAGDADAYLALQETGTSIPNGSTGSVLVLTNQFGSDVDLRIRDVSTTDTVTSEGLTNTTLAPGDRADLEVTCTSATDGRVTVDIVASGDGIAFETTTTVAVGCES